MFGNNPIRSVIKSDGNFLFVQDVFLTIQGEGPLVGVPSIFVRLGGCNLACNFCDTEFESFEQSTLDQILERIHALKGSSAVNLIVITGGEPMRQPIEKFCELLIGNGFQVQIETNGTIFRELPQQVSIVCSPKAGKAGYHNIRSDLLKRLTAIKFIISKNQKLYSNVPDLGQTIYNTEVYVQPMDEQDDFLNRQNVQLAIEIAQKFGYRLSLQTHKFIGIP
jgi:organic radical activating enzyme